MDLPCTCSKVRRASRALTRLYDDALAPAGLTTTQFAVLRTLERLGPSSVAELARATGHDRSAMTRTLRPLDLAGYIERGRRIGLTDAGQAAIRRAEPGWRAAQARVEAGLGSVDRERLFALLDTVEALAPFAEART